MLRPFNSDTDREAAHRIWRECGWLPEDNTTAMDAYVDAGRALVAEIEGAAECLALSQFGTLRYQDEDLRWACVTGITTSQVARKSGHASRLVAQLVAADALDGALVSGLGMFEQGFYDRVGFGTGGYEIRVKLDPARLVVDQGFRVPRRLSPDDVEAMLACRLKRYRAHGAVNLPHTGHLLEQGVGNSKGFGFGWYEGEELTHYVWFTTDNRESGPYYARFMPWQTGTQLLELLAFLRSLGDQVHLIELDEPAGVQLQDFVRQPLRESYVRRGARTTPRVDAAPYWQMRINDLPACLAHTRLPGDSVRLNLRLSDPIETLLPAGHGWSGVAGDYVIELGPLSGAQVGCDDSLPTLTTTVNAFTRLWLGVRPASGLAITDELAAPAELLAALDRVVRLPAPRPDWQF